MVGRPTLTSPPSSEPIALALVKQMLRIDLGDTSQDTYLTLLISTARELAEQHTTRGYLYQSYREYYDHFPGHHLHLESLIGVGSLWSGVSRRRHGSHAHDYFELSRSPLAYLKQIQYLDPTGTVQTLDPGQYVLSTSQEPARIERVPYSLGGLPWPIVLREPDTVWIDYGVGYGNNLTISMAAASSAITGYTFLPSDVGSIISIPGAGASVTVEGSTSVATLVTTIAAVDDAGNGTTAAPATTAVTNAPAYLGNQIPYGDTQAMLMLISHWDANRLPMQNVGIPAEIEYAVKYLLDKNRVYYQP
jgi:hypothetical protein